MTRDPEHRVRSSRRTAVSVVTVGELRHGVLMAQDVETRHRRLTTLELALSLDPLPIDDRAADVWAGLVPGLRAQGGRMPLNGSWIAASAMQFGLRLITTDAHYQNVGQVAVELHRG